MIRLRGKWLREFGFDEGGTVRVSAKQGEIRLTVEGHGKQRPAGQGELF
jgi:formylmethanofuran dehydrogenase subunit D